MAHNFLEQLVAEWHEYQGFFVRRNVLVGKRANGGYNGELDVVAFHPLEKRLVHVECTMDADSWDKREAKFKRKFETGRKHIPELFRGLSLPSEIEQIALLGFGTDRDHPTLGGGRVELVRHFIAEIANELSTKKVESSAVPEHFTVLRSIQFVSVYWRPSDSEKPEKSAA